MSPMERLMQVNRELLARDKASLAAFDTAEHKLYRNHEDISEEWKAELRRRIAEMEELIAQYG